MSVLVRGGRLDSPNRGRSEYKWLQSRYTATPRQRGGSGHVQITGRSTKRPLLGHCRATMPRGTLLEGPHDSIVSLFNCRMNMKGPQGEASALDLFETWSALLEGRSTPLLKERADSRSVRYCHIFEPPQDNPKTGQPDVSPSSRQRT
jgi:hypothetical protein